MNIDILIAFIIFLFGTIFGSFYNVIIYRLPLEMSIAKGRSMCFSCKHILGVFDLFPLFSYIFLGGKCRYCNAKISIRYFLVEFFVGILFLVAYIKFGISYEFVLMLVFWSMLTIVGLIDLDTMAIYDSVLIFFSAISFIILVIYKGFLVKDNIIGGIIGFFIYYSIYFIAKLIYKQEAFGYGDVLLNSAIGLVLGKVNIILSSFFSFFVALFFIILLLILGRKLKFKQELPFGPYMCISAFIVSIFANDIIDFYINNFL